MGNLEKNIALNAENRADFALIAKWIAPNAGRRYSHGNQKTGLARWISLSLTHLKHFMKFAINAKRGFSSRAHHVRK